MKRGVLLMAYGAPNALEDVEPFYTDIRRGRKPPPALLEELLERYRAIGGKSPLLDITRRQAAAVERALGDGYRVFVGMRHWAPWIRDAVADMDRAGIRDAAAIVLAPHYSRMSIGRYMALVDEVAAGTALAFRKVLHWHTHPRYLDALEARVRETLTRFDPSLPGGPAVLFTAHSLPQSIPAQNDPYPAQLAETARLLAGRLALPKWQVAYQSAGRTPEPWLGPDILRALDALRDRGERGVLICVIGFVADHLEVLYDLDIAARGYAKERGLQLERIAMLNDDPVLADALADLARRAFEAAV
jgi:ferrochelatase